MDPDKIKLETMDKLFEYEKLSREIDNINDVDSLKNHAKSHLKLYLKQQEVISKLI